MTKYTTFSCEQCDKEFVAEQGCRRKYCDKCTTRRLIAGAKNKPRKPDTSLRQSSGQVAPDHSKLPTTKPMP